eukprot:227774-Pelagomonas_calceolata.AAC.1
MGAAPHRASWQGGGHQHALALHLSGRSSCNSRRRRQGQGQGQEVGKRGRGKGLRVGRARLSEPLEVSEDSTLGTSQIKRWRKEMRRDQKPQICKGREGKGREGKGRRFASAKLPPQA